MGCCLRSQDAFLGMRFMTYSLGGQHNRWVSPSIMMPPFLLHPMVVDCFSLVWLTYNCSKLHFCCAFLTFGTQCSPRGCNFGRRKTLAFTRTEHLFPFLSHRQYFFSVRNECSARPRPGGAGAGIGRHRDSGASGADGRGPPPPQSNPSSSSLGGSFSLKSAP